MRRNLFQLLCFVAVLCLFGTQFPNVATAQTSVAATELVSVANDGSQANSDSSNASISANGRFVAFESRATNLVNGDTNNWGDIFVHDRQTGLTQLVSVSSDGSQANGSSYRPSISSDGRFVAFESDATNLVEGDTNHQTDIFVRDRQMGTTNLVSIASDGQQANSWSWMPAISADGRLVAFWSQAGNLVDGVPYYEWYGVYLHDTETGVTELVSYFSDWATANHDSYAPAVSPDARFVAFWSLVRNLTGITYETFVRDRQTGITESVSVASDGTQGNGTSNRQSSISADGRFVGFWSSASNFFIGDSENTYDFFVHDRQTGETRHIAPAIDATNPYYPSSFDDKSSMSIDGRYVTFVSYANGLVGEDTNCYGDVYIYDMTTQVIDRVSIAYDGTQPNNPSNAPSISADGRFVAFTSEANNLVRGDVNRFADIFVRDRYVSVANYSISGQVKDTDGRGLSGVTVSAEEGRSAITNSLGFYTLPGLLSGVHKITPFMNGMTFNPAWLEVTIYASNVAGQDFTRALPSTASGEITSPLENAIIGTQPFSITANAWTTSSQGVKEVAFSAFYNGAWHNIGIDSVSPYSVPWTPPASLEPQRLAFAIQVTDNESSTTPFAGGTRFVSFIDALGNPDIQENWISNRAYLNQMSLVEWGGSKCSVSSMAMLLAAEGFIQGDYVALRDKANDMYTRVSMNPNAGAGGTVGKIQIELSKQPGLSAEWGSYTVDEAWAMIKQEIDQERPVIVRTAHGWVTEDGHYILAVGYREAYGGRSLIAYDPAGKWKGTYRSYDWNKSTPDSHKGQWVFYNFESVFVGPNPGPNDENNLVTAKPAQKPMGPPAVKTLSALPKTPPDIVSDEPEDIRPFDGVSDSIFVFLPMLMRR